MDSSVSPKDEMWFLRVCHHISTGLYYWQTEARQLRDWEEDLIYSRRIRVQEIVIKQSFLTWGT